MSQSIVEKDNIQSPQPDPNEIWPLSGDDRGYPCVCVCSRRVRAFVHRLSSVETCVSEGVSLEEQVRRIKDIEAIESDSFVPQAFKSSRDDVKVRPVPLSLPSSHSSPHLLLNLPPCIATCRLSGDGPDQIKHSRERRA